MADNDGITRTQSFTERTLKYGRNLMAAAVPIIVFALVPVVDLAKSRPLNFEITAGGEIWIWLILLALLLYYGCRFFGLAILDFHEWRRLHGTVEVTLKGNLESQIETEKAHRDDLAIHHQDWDDATNPNKQEQWHTRDAGLKTKTRQMKENLRVNCSELTQYYSRRAYFWLFDAGPPVAFFAVAAIAASIEIINLLPAPDTPPNP